jgi:ABC-type multidrug transport system fused ATPase/permease subunit
MSLKLKQKTVLIMSLALLVPIIFISSISIYVVYSKTRHDIEAYREEEFAKLKVFLKHITDVAYGSIEAAYHRTTELPQDSAGLVESTRKAILDQCLLDLSKVRFDNGEGYFWVTNNTVPHPTMLMHAEKMNLVGEVLSDPKYNVERHESRNIYQVRAEQSNKNSDAYVEYVMKKPGTDVVNNKISYSRLFAPLGWIVSTGIYTDQIDEAVALKKEALSKQITNIVLLITGVSTIILLIGLVVAFSFSQQLTSAIVTIKEKVGLLAKGHQVEGLKTDRNDEVGDMIYSLNDLASGLKTYTTFAKEIGQGNLTKTFTPLSEGDILGKELLLMADNLRKANEEKDLRDWTNEGLALLGDVLRRHSSDVQTLCNEALPKLIKYLTINQGSLFVIKEDERNNQYLEMTATYAFDRKKYVEKRVDIGQGLLGQSILDRSTTYLKEVPRDYIHITSGLGDAPPQCILIVPMVYYDKAYGVIELASFEDFADHQIKFVEKIASDIAATLVAVQTNEKTKLLLKESQEMAEQLKSQEEELRQNQEEMQATQEEMQRRLQELERENLSLKNSLKESVAQR